MRTDVGETVVQVRDLAKRYGEIRAVDGVSFDVGQGQVFGLLGPNGAGKTTTIECIEGLRRPDEGSVRVLGLSPIKDGYELRQRMGIQLQAAALPPRIKVGEALDLFSAFYRSSVDWRLLLEQMGLAQRRTSYLAKLSGGQRQRVFIALALLNDPEVVFLDELTTGLDPQARRAMWDLVRDMRSREKTVFLTTHSMEEAERLCDRIAIMDYGKIVALDTPGNLIASLQAEHRVILSTDDLSCEALLRNVPGVARVERIGERVIVYGEREGLLGRLVAVLEEHRVAFADLRTEQPTLEDVFLALTGREMRE
jgi:ABC-2 type transport system ATP-binding protein